MDINSRIAFISEHASPLAVLGGIDTGGQNVYVAQVATHLADLGYLVDVFTRRENQKGAMVINWKPGVRVIHIKAGPAEVIPKEEILEYMPQFTQSMLHFIHETGVEYDLSHANFFMSAMVSADLKRIIGLPFAVTFHALGHVRRIHQGNSDLFPPQRLAIEESIVQQADYIIAECPQDREDLINHYHAPSYKIVTIPCGFSSREFYPVDKTAARDYLGLPQNQHILLQLGRMVPRKGVDNVIRSLKHLKCTENVCLLIVGGDSDNPDDMNSPELNRLRNIAHENRVSTCIKFAGRKSREELKYYYAAADLFITTPWYEPFGITPLEAMACGTPVIGADVGGIKYSVIDGETGALVPPENPLALAGKIDVLINNQTLLNEMGSNSIKRVTAHFTWSTIAVSIHRLYRTIIKMNTCLQLAASRTTQKAA